MCQCANWSPFFFTVFLMRDGDQKNCTMMKVQLGCWGPRSSNDIRWFERVSSSRSKWNVVLGLGTVTQHRPSVWSRKTITYILFMMFMIFLIWLFFLLSSHLSSQGSAMVVESKLTKFVPRDAKIEFFLRYLEFDVRARHLRYCKARVANSNLLLAIHNLQSTIQLQSY